MSAAELLAGFSHRGIQLKAEGERLIYDAPVGQLQASDLEKLRSHKSELLAYLNREAANTIAESAGSCSDCGSGRWWQIPGQAWPCRACEPDMLLTATTLTVPCHKEQVRPIGSHDGLKCMIQNACQGLSITPEQLCQELIESSDISGLAAGALHRMDCG